MLDKLIDVILEFLDKILPVYIVKQYAKAAHFRFGKFLKVAESGLHWKVPFADDIDQYITATTTLTLPVQSVTTLDGIGVVVKGHIKYSITDISIYGVEVTDAIDALSDVTCGIIHENVKKMKWEDLRSSDLSSQISKEVKYESKKWGITTYKVTITDLAQMKSIRLFNEGPNKLIDQ